MELHPLTETERNHLRTILDHTPMTAWLRVNGRTVTQDEPPTDEEISALENGDPPSLSFELRTLGVRLVGVTCTRAGADENKKTRWEFRFETESLDRLASIARHRDWRHGLIGRGFRAVWRTADERDLSGRSPALAPLLEPDEFAAVRWDASREKEKDRGRDLPLVNVGPGGESAARRPAAKARKH